MVYELEVCPGMSVGKSGTLSPSVRAVLHFHLLATKKL